MGMPGPKAVTLVQELFGDQASDLGYFKLHNTQDAANSQRPSSLLGALARSPCVKSAPPRPIRLYVPCRPRRDHGG